MEVTAEVAMVPSRSQGVKLLLKGKPDESYIIKKLRGEDITATDSTGNADAQPMPPDAQLCDAKIIAIADWIKAGALDGS